ncbi:MAG: hypothetical protein AAF514_04790 [Verrucomicrobiota bacterium]
MRPDWIDGCFKRIAGFAVMAFWMGAVVGSAQAQGTIESRLQKLRDRFGTEIHAASRPTLENYTKALETIEKEAVQRGDFDQAGKAARESRYWMGYLRGTGDDLNREPLDVAVTFDLSKAGKRGGVIYREQKLIRWTNQRSDASWDLQRLVPGTYVVEVVYSCNEKKEKQKQSNGKEIEVKAGGAFEFQEVTNLVGLKGRTLRHAVLPTESWDDFRTERIGRLTVRGTSGRFLLRATEVHPQGLMRLKSLRFLREKKERPGRDEKRELQANQQLEKRLKAYAEAKETAATARVAAYVRTLKELIGEAKRAGDDGLERNLVKEMEAVIEGRLP